MKIITAVGNRKINDELSKTNKYDVLGQDIQYQDGIFEMLEKNKNIDYIIVKENLFGNLDFNELINKIIRLNKKIKIIAILEKENETNKKIINSGKIYKKILNNEININKIKNILNQEERNIENKKLNIGFLKINKKNLLIFKNIYKKIFYRKNKTKNNYRNDKKIICILGTSGVGKSIFSVLLSLSIQKKKILLIDFNNNNGIFTILGKEKKYNKNFYLTNDNKINENFFISNIEKQTIKKTNGQILKKIIGKLNREFDYIFIDISSERENQYIKNIIKISNFNIFLVEPNILEISKSKKMLDNYINVFKLDREKIKIVFNKVNNNSIAFSLLKELFCDFSILGTIKLKNKYSLYINKNAKLIDKKIKKEYFKIIKKIEEV